MDCETLQEEVTELKLLHGTKLTVFGNNGAEALAQNQEGCDY